jgi:hypothetical protein
MAGRCTPALVLCVVLATQAVVCADELPPAPLDPDQVAWKELHFAAHKLGISATVEVRIEARPASPAGLPWVILDSTSRLPGRMFSTHERLDGADARARQIVDTEVGAKNHRKTYTLTARGFLFDLLEPASHAESALPPEGWTRQTRTFTVYPKALPGGTAITGPAGLLYAASAAGLAAPGDSLTVYVLVRTQVERVTVHVEGVEQVPLDFQEDSGGPVTTVKEPLAALRIVARSQPVDAASASAFRIFGLEGDVEILWDPTRRIPVELTGKVKLLGHVEVRLASVTLNRSAAR